MKYRPDIDGLRAIAVASVVLFHARTPLLSGGFVGVDIFFVISGFLITSIIVREIETGTFSLADFYERRIRRIFPALFVVIAATLALGWYVLTPGDYRKLADSALRTAGFLSNFYFNRQAGYFAPAAETQPLLHTWSLAVEEQFYLVAPIALLFLFKLSSSGRMLAFGIIAVASLFYAELGVRHEWSEAFYLLPSRAWQLMTGMVLALGWIPQATRFPTTNLLAATGLILIFVSVVGFSNLTPFPGLAALIPSVGAALIIHAGLNSMPVVNRVLATRPFVGVGKISYSLYLWHWPILAYAAYEWGSAITDKHRAIAIALSVALSIVTWAYIEQPARRRKPGTSPAKPFAAGFAAILACLVVGQVIRTQQGFIGRVPPQGRAIAEAANKKLTIGPFCKYDGVEQTKVGLHCVLGDPGATNRSFLIWGDSHAMAVAGAIHNAAAALHRKGALLTTGGCPPLLGLDSLSSKKFAICVQGSKPLQSYLNNPAVTDIVIIARWALYAEGTASSRETNVRIRRFVDADESRNREVFSSLLEETTRAFRAEHKRVTIIASIPELPENLPSKVLKDIMRGASRDYALPRQEFDKRQSTTLPVMKKLEQLSNVMVLYPHEVLCSETSCKTVVGEKLLYHDDDHLNAAGAALLEPLFTRALGTP